MFYSAEMEIYIIYYSYSKHMNTEDAERLGRELNAKEFWCVHMSHKIPWDYPYGARDMQSWEL